MDDICAGFSKIDDEKNNFKDKTCEELDEILFGLLTDGIDLESRKKSGSEDLQAQLGNELADVIHYAIAIAALNDLDMNQIIIEKDKAASVKYNHRTNLEQFIVDMRNKELDN